MSVLLNIDISRQFQIAPNTVKNWIDQTLNGKLNFDLIKVGEKHHIRNTPENIDLIQRLKHVNARFRPAKKTVAEIEPNSEFYKLFSDRQIIDLIHSIETYNYIPVKYSYFGNGAQIYFNAIEDELRNPTSISALEQAQVSEYLVDTVMSFVRQGFKINLIEIGHDYSTYQLIDTVKELIKLDAFKSYITVSASEAMNKIRLEKVRVWTKHVGKSYNLDYELDSLKEMLFLEKDKKTINICLALSSCLGNSAVFTAGFHSLCRNLGNRDFLILSESLFYEEKYVDNNSKIMVSGLRQERYKPLLENLNLEDLLLQGDIESFGFYSIKSRYNYLKQSIKLKLIVTPSNLYYLEFKKMEKIYYINLANHKLENLISIVTNNYLLKNLKIPHHKRVLMLIGARENTIKHY